MPALDPAAPNIMPTRYRSVALSTDLASLDPDWLIQHFKGREAYMRTRFIVARSGEDTALLEVLREETDTLFTPMDDLRVLAGAEDCCYVMAPEADAGIASHLAEIADQHRDKRCVVIEGRYGHVSFVLNPDPIRLHILDIVPPGPSKLLDQVKRVIDATEDLPPMVITPDIIDSRDELRAARKPLPPQVLVPCRGGGIDVEGVEVSYLDERPEARDWTLLGCERSHQIHRWFYDSEPDTVDICPKRFMKDLNLEGGQLMTRCCLLQIGIEEHPEAMMVPWGASLAEVREALEGVVKRAGQQWTRI